MKIYCVDKILLYLANKYNTNYLEDDEEHDKEIHGSNNNHAFDILKFIKLSDFKNKSDTLFTNSMKFLFIDYSLICLNILL